MFRIPVLVASLVLGLATATPAAADNSPTLLIESGPSDTPGYRRMVLVHYLNGSGVNVSYKALNRTEFSQAPGSASPQAVSDCARGAATSLREIDAFQEAEARRARAGQTPEVVRFCIKGVGNWEARNKDRYLDPIFEGMPYTAARR